jgi:hypothetical protein
VYTLFRVLEEVISTAPLELNNVPCCEIKKSPDTIYEPNLANGVNKASVITIP